MSRQLAKDLTSYDLLKTAAVILMIIDHIGAYLMPEIQWMRMAGRFCVPMWFFLIGYARSRDTGLHLWIAALVLVVSDFIVGMTIFPLNILVTILFVRFVLDRYMKIVSRHWALFFAGGLLLFVIALPSSLIIDYGVQGLVLAAFGYVVRLAQDDPHRRLTEIFPCLVFSAVFYTLMQWVVFDFTGLQGLILLAGTLVVLLLLVDFRPATFPRAASVLSRPVVLILQMVGRNNLLIYVGHLLVIKALGLWLLPHSFHFLGWSLLPWSLMRQF